MSNMRFLKVPFWDLFVDYLCKWLHLAIKYSKVYHFADDTNLLNFGCCVKSINKQVYYDSTKLVNWLKENKSFRNTSKIELLLFISP